jgi:hypothetical protein
LCAVALRAGAGAGVRGEFDADAFFAGGGVDFFVAAGSARCVSGAGVSAGAGLAAGFALLTDASVSATGCDGCGCAAVEVDAGVTGAATGASETLWRVATYAPPAAAVIVAKASSRNASGLENME